MYKELTDEEARAKAQAQADADWAPYGGDPYAPGCSEARAMAIAANLKESQERQLAAIKGRAS